MKKLLPILYLLLPVFSTAQNSLKNIARKSMQTFVYRITAADASRFIKWDSIPVSRFVKLTPSAVFTTDSMNEDELITGNYVLISASENNIAATLICVSDLIALPINNKQQVQIDIRTKAGVFITDAKVMLGNKAAIYKEQSKTWWVSKKQKKDALISVYTSGDTLFTQLEAKDDLYPSIAQQRKYNYRHSRLFQLLHWFPATIQSWFRKSTNKYARTGATGYIIFNQPKYKPLDTVKFKGYVIDKKWHQYKKPIDAYLNYRVNGKNISQLISTILPTVSGSYIGSFVLADSIPLDINCNIIFSTPEKKEVIREQFNTEDYLLDDVATYTFKSEKPVYFRNDTLRFSANAKDANGLAVVGATAALLLTVQKINRFYNDTIFVADTIYQQEIKVSANEGTRFAVPSNALPRADITINARLIFLNSNNESHEENDAVEYKYLSKEILLTQQADSIKAVYVENGAPVEKQGEMEMNDDTAIAIHFPCTVKIDPIAGDYTFYTTEKNIQNRLVQNIEIRNDYQLHLTRVNSGDTIGFTIDNPLKIPVYFTVLDGKKIVAAGKQSDVQVIWKKVVANHCLAYKVRWQYIWAGKELDGEETIGLLYKLLTIKINANPIVFPGQADSIAVEVKDYKGNPAVGVNLTAVSYNSQFKKDIRVPEPPYLAKYKRRQYIKHDGFEAAGSIKLKNQYLLGRNQEWIKKLNLDTMRYYRLLFPAENYFDAATLIGSFVPQVSVSAVDNGVPQEIYLLYINRELVYYNGVKDSMQYAFPVFPGYTQLGIRLRGKYIEIDSIYIQPNYKHDISIDINRLPAHSTITQIPPFWSDNEKSLLERSFLHLDNNLYNGSAYLWQDDRVIKLSGNNEHLAGPFRPAEIQFFSPGNFDIAFNFEPGYRYNLSKKIARLEKQSIFPPSDTKIFLPSSPITRMKIGDTLLSPPPIIYPPVKIDPFIRLIQNDYSHTQNASKMDAMAGLQLGDRKDSFFTYIILVRSDRSQKPLFLHYNANIKNLLPGRYIMFLITNNFYAGALRNIMLTDGGTNCVDIDGVNFLATDTMLNRLIKEAADDLISLKGPVKEKRGQIQSRQITSGNIYLITGTAISGKIIDNQGRNAIPFVLVNVKGYQRGVVCNASGSFVIANLQPGKYTLVFSSVGYETREVLVDCNSNERKVLNIVLKVSSLALNEVVVVGYGTAVKRDITGSITQVKADRLSFNMLAGKVSGVSLSNQQGLPGDAALIRIRGMSTGGGSNAPLYVIDGILYDALPKNFQIASATGVNVLTATEAIALYGSRAANGAVVITTQTKTFRKAFSDYAFWQPELLTDKQGRVSFTVRYPDNITGWMTFVVAMDKKRRMGKAVVLTQAYKPMTAQLSVPRFLIAGDSAVIIGKAINYTTDKYAVETKFEINGLPAGGRSAYIAPGEANIDEILITSSVTDTINTSFSLTSTTGFKDGEERKTPVYNKGVEEATGNFWVLQNDTGFSFNAQKNVGEINIYAQLNTLNVLLEELDHLRKYPYSCMEQIASKLSGLAMEKMIRLQLKQPFKDDVAIEKLLQKVQKAQLFEGGWPWWENGKSNFYVTNYITNALLSFRGNQLVATNIRNAFLYLQHQLPSLNMQELLTALATLSEGGHEMNYAQWINAIPFDSLNQHQQWLWVKIKQQQQMEYHAELQRLIDKKINTVQGGVHWGTENYNWYSNETATTILAYGIIKNEAAFVNLIPAIIQYFLNKRNGGNWANTVESAGIVSTILPEILKLREDFLLPATIKISGDTNFVIKKFPYKAKLNASTIKNLHVSKEGGGMVYITAWQNLFNPLPEPVQDKFIVNTVFKKDNRDVSQLKAGENVTLKVTVDMLKDAEYVMLQVPIPAGCTYAAKKKDAYNSYSQFYKDRLMIFEESLPKGTYQFDIELEPRYTGSYTLNPAKAELMYYPVFFGRNGLKRVNILK